MILAYNFDYVILQAHRIISWRVEAEQLERAKLADTPVQAHSDYCVRLLQLYLQSKSQIFQASRRVVHQIQALLDNSDSAEQIFLPGYTYVTLATDGSD